MSSSSPEVRGQILSDLERAEVRSELEKILESDVFSTSQRRKQLLRHLVEATLDGRGADINEYALAQDVFERPASFDPRIDSTVRAEMSRLRKSLREYYSGEGVQDRIQIEFSSRGYAATFVARSPQNVVPAETPEAEIDARQEAPQNITTPNPTSPGSLMPSSWIWIALFAVISIPPVLYWLHTRTDDTSPVRSIVVLPFMNLSGNPQNEYLADGLTEELTNELAQREDLRVVARTSAFQFKGKAIDVRQIGRELNVDAVLEGSMEKQGDRLRVTAQLNRTSNGYHVWSREFEGQSEDLLELQDDVARSIAGALGNGRQPPQEPAGHATSAEAHDLYLQGLYQYSLQSPASYKKARQLMQRAIEKDPNYVNAYLALARVEVVLVHITAESPDEGLPRAREALEKALAIDPQNAEAHGQLASVQYIYGWDWPHAEQEFRTAIAHGAQAPTRSAYGWSLGTRGRFAEAHQQLAIAQELDPLGIGPRGNEVMVYMLEHNYEGGKRILRGIMDRKPDSLDAHLLLGLYAAIERNCAAATDYANWDIKNFQAPASLFEMALSSACHADLTQSRKYLEQMAAPGEKGGYVSPYQIALGYAYIGDKAQALDYLSQSMAAKEGQILYIKYDPIFDGIRSDPRFRAMEQRAGLD